MQQIQDERAMISRAVDRLEEVVLRVNPDVWLGGLLVWVLAPWMARLF